MPGYRYGSDSCAEYKRIYGKDLFDDIKKHLGIKGGGCRSTRRNRRNRKY